MALFMFVVACAVFVSTITWLSYKLGETKTLRPKASCLLGFVLSFIPPLGLLYIGILAFKEDSALVD